MHSLLDDNPTPAENFPTVHYQQMPQEVVSVSTNFADSGSFQNSRLTTSYAVESLHSVASSDAVLGAQAGGDTRDTANTSNAGETGRRGIGEMELDEFPSPNPSSDNVVHSDPTSQDPVNQMY